MLGETAHSGHDSCPCHAAYYCGHCATGHLHNYTAAMIGKSCSDFIAVGLHMSAAKQLLHTDIWVCHSGAASRLYAAPVLQS